MKSLFLKRRTNGTVFLAFAIAIVTLLNGQGVGAVQTYDNGLWAGKNVEDGAVLFVWIQNTQLTIVRLVAKNRCSERATDRDYSYLASPGGDALANAPPFYVEANGRIRGGFEISDGLYKGLTIELRGELNNRDGRIVVTLSSSTDLENCAYGNIIKMHWINSRNILEPGTPPVRP